MTALPAFSIKRPTTTVMLTLIVVILGVVAFTNLQQELMPEINFGIAIVVSSFDGAGPEEVENLVTRPLESALSTVTNLQNMTTNSLAGTSIIIMEFEDGTDMNHASLNMRENIDMFSMLLPDGVDPMVFQIDVNMMQAFVVGVTGDFDLVRLRNIVDEQVVRRIERLDGVGSVDLSGGLDREISVELNPAQLVNYGITAQQIAGLLSMENVNRPGGTLAQGDSVLQVRTVMEFGSIQEIENLPIQTPRGAVIRLSNVARVVDGFREVTGYSVINGRQGVTLSISQQSTANTVEVGSRINAELEQLRLEYPELEFTVIMDTSEFIVQALGNVWTTVIQATVAAVLVLLLFLGSARSPMIIAVSVPVSIIASLALMYFMDMTLNMVTLNALVISVAMLVDNSIVVLENISRYIDQGVPPMEAARKGSQEVSTAVFAATMTTVVVFVPVLFVGGIAGEMFGQLGLVLSIALICSLIVAMTFVPMACSKFLRPRKSAEDAKGIRLLWRRWNQSYKVFESWYDNVLHWALRHKKIVVGVFFLFLIGSGSVIGMMGMEFMSPMDQGRISISIEAPQGGRLEEISRLTQTALRRIEDMEVIEDISVTVGGAGGLGALFGGGSNTSSMFIQLVPMDYRPHIDDIMEEMRERIAPLPGAEFVVGTGGGMGMGGGGNSISFNLYGDDMYLLAQTGNQIVQLISTLPDIRNAETSLAGGHPQARVEVDRQRATHFGLQASVVANTVQMAIGGSTVTQYRVDGSEIDVVLRYQPERLGYIADLRNLMLSTPLGVSVPLSEIADIVMEEGPQAITKSNQQPFITISAEFVDSDLGTISQEIITLLDDFIFLGGITYSFGGEFEMMMESFAALGMAMMLGFVLLYMVIASQFESLAYPATILFSIPIAWTAGLFGIFITGGNISVIAFIGLILLMGIVVNNGIILVDFINIKRREGLTTIDAIHEAGRARIRPILMTTLTTVFGLMPMMFATAEGAEMQQPLGVIIVFGLTLSTTITLVLIPVLYLILHNVRKKLFAKKYAHEI